MFVLLEAEVGGRAGKVSGGMWNTVLFMNNTIIFPFALTAVRVGGDSQTGTLVEGLTERGLHIVGRDALSLLFPRQRSSPLTLPFSAWRIFKQTTGFSDF